MSQFKRFNSSDSGSWDTGSYYPPGTLTWDPDNGLRLHDGNTNGGNQIGGNSTVNWGDIQYRPYGASAVHDLFGGGSSLNTGKFLMQTSTTESAWTALPTTYDTLTINTKVLGGIDGAAGTRITGINCDTKGSGVPYQYVFLGGNQAFGDLFNRGSSIEGWKMYPANNPGAFVTITQFLNNNLGGPSLAFDGPLQDGPWIAESSDYNAGTPGPLVLSADTLNWTLGTDGYLTLPAGGSISDYDAGNGDASIGSSLTGSGYSQIYWDGAPGTGDPYNGSDLFTWMYVDYEGITLGYVNASQSKDYEWKFNTNGDLTLPANGDIKNSSGVSVLSNQSLNTSSSPEFAFLYLNASNGDEGGEMRLALAENTNLTGTGITIDVYQDRLRIFEQGGDARGFYIDLTDGAANAGTNLGNYNDLINKPTIPTDVSNLTDNSGLLPAAQIRYEKKSSPFTAVAGKTYWIDSTAGTVSVTLPYGPSVGDWVKFYDASLNWQTNPLSVGGNGQNIKTINMGGGGWNSPASSVSVNQAMISPVGPFPASFVWDGSYWHGAM
jgi:hypothetical protein